MLSLSERKRQEIAEPAHHHYWGAPTRKDELAEYVCCAFMPPWGMCQEHREEFALLVLEAEAVCTQEGTLFCPTNSAKSQYSVEDIRSMSKIEGLDACFPNSETYQAYPEAEVLVWGTVPLFRLLGIVFCDQVAHDYWMPRLREAEIPDTVRSRMRRPVIKVRQFDGFRFPHNYVVEKRVRE